MERHLLSPSTLLETHEFPVNRKTPSRNLRGRMSVRSFWSIRRLYIAGYFARYVGPRSSSSRLQQCQKPKTCGQHPSRLSVVATYESAARWSLGATSKPSPESYSERDIFSIVQKRPLSVICLSLGGIGEVSDIARIW